MKTYKIYPSSAAFCKGTLADSSYNSTCFRYQLVTQRNKVRFGQPHELNKAVGAIDEDRYLYVLQKEFDEVKAEERVTVDKFAGYKELKFSGRIDYECYQEGKLVEIVEKKSTISASQKSNIKHKRPQSYQIAQLCSYLVAKNISKGRLVQTYYNWSKDLQSLEVGAEVEYHITFKGQMIQIDGEDYRPLNDLLKFFKILADSIVTGVVPERPATAEEYRGPCNYCPLASVCNMFDTGGMSNQDFEKMGVQVLETQEETPRAVRIHHRKR